MSDHAQNGEGWLRERTDRYQNAVTSLADVQRLAEDGTDEYDFIPYESDVDDEGYDAEVFAQYRGGATALAANTGRKCERKQLLRVPTRIEFKTRGWKLYRRTRYNVTFLVYCYPDNLGHKAEDAIRKCLPGDRRRGGGVAAGGPGAVAPAFIAALKSCVTGDLAGSVSIRIDNDEEIGRWHRL